MSPGVYILTAILVFLGLICGMIISRMAREEIKPGKRYFGALQDIITALILFFTMAFFRVNPLLNIIFVAMFLIVSRMITFPRSYIMYPVFGVLLYLSSIKNGIFAIISSLVFLYGFPTAAMQIDFKKKNYFRVVVCHFPFILSSLFLGFFA